VFYVVDVAKFFERSTGVDNSPILDDDRYAATIVPRMAEMVFVLVPSGPPALLKPGKIGRESPLRLVFGHASKATPTSVYCQIRLAIMQKIMHCGHSNAFPLLFWIFLSVLPQSVSLLSPCHPLIRRAFRAIPQPDSFLAEFALAPSGP
jgi:hypothetical protein